jgi:hypothetical protein
MAGRDLIPRTVTLPTLLRSEDAVKWASSLVNRLTLEFARFPAAFKEGLIREKLVPIGNGVTLGPAALPFTGFAYVSDDTNNNSAIYELRGAAHAVRVVYSGGAEFTNSPGTAGKINVFWNGTGYVIENLTGGNVVVAFSALGGVMPENPSA